MNRSRHDELVRLATSQRESGQKLRQSIMEARAEGVPWRLIADTIGTDFRTLQRQFSTGGPIVVVRPVKGASHMVMR